MSWLLKARIAIAAMGIVTWAYALRVDDARLRLAGIVMLSISLALRFLGRRRQPDQPDQPANPSPPGDPSAS